MADLRTSITSFFDRLSKRGDASSTGAATDAPHADKAHAIDEGDPTRTVVSDDPSRNPDNR